MCGNKKNVIRKPDVIGRRGEGSFEEGRGGSFKEKHEVLIDIIGVQRYRGTETSAEL